jgi:peptide/nickel transport system substrate-binding protein
MEMPPSAFVSREQRLWTNREIGMRRIGLAILAMLAMPVLALPAMAEPAHGIAMHGRLKYPAGFVQFDYVNPDAPKGGRLGLVTGEAFDSLNPLIIKGVAAPGIRGYVYESLLERSADEPFSLYGLIAETVETPDDRSWVEFQINPKARFSDGKPVTAADVIFSMELLREHGRPNHRSFYQKVTKAETKDDRTVRFTFDGSGDREMPLIMGLMPVLPKHAVDTATFESTSLAAPIGSGPYLVADVVAGRSITYRRNPDYWAADLNVMRGRFNMDEVRYDVIRDANSRFDSFKTGELLLWPESDPSNWSSLFDVPAVRDGRIEKLEFETGVPAGMLAFVMNTRRPPFDDPRVRQALIHLFDFEWINKNLYFGLYSRTESYFDRSELSAAGRPADGRERALLAPFADAVKPEVLEGTYRLPQSDGSGRDRAPLREALKLLKQAGYELKDGILVKTAGGKPLEIEFLTQTAEQERLVLTYAATLKRAGIALVIRQMDKVQYQQRLSAFDFDMMQFTYPASLSPGNEQSFRWSAASAEAKGSYNFAGIKSPAADAMIAAVLAAKDRESFVSAVRALDRVLISGDYVVPLFHLKAQWVAIWKQLRRPATTPLSGYQTDTWWIAPSP